MLNDLLTATRAFGRRFRRRRAIALSLLPAALFVLGMPLLHAAHPPAPPAAPAGHEAHAHDSSEEALHAYLSCECLLCKVVQVPVLLPEGPSGSTELRTQEDPSVLGTASVQPYRLPPGRAPPLAT